MQLTRNNPTLFGCNVQCNQETTMSLNLEKMLYDKLVEHFTKEKEKMEGRFPCTQEEIGEFFEDGKKILSYFSKKLDKLYTKSGFELVQSNKS